MPAGKFRLASEEKMNGMKLDTTNVFESNRVIDLPDGPVRVCEREIHESYSPDTSPPRLIISEAIDLTLTFIAKAREEFSELNSVMRELATR